MQDRRTGRVVRSMALLVVLGLAAAACGSDGGDKQANTVTPPGAAPAIGEECGSPVGDTSKPESGGTLVYGIEAETDGWNPGSSRFAPSGLMVARTIFDTITVYDKDAKAQPYLVKSMEPNEDFTEWTFTVRDGVKFHNGTPFDAAALKAHFDFHMASALTNVPFKPVEDVGGVTQLDDKRVLIKLEERWVNFPNALTTQIGMVAEPNLVKTGDFQNNPVGTGAFTFDSWTRDKELKVAKNPSYWQKGYPLLDAIIFKPIIDDQSRTTALETGDADAIMVTDAKQIENLCQNAGEAYNFFEDRDGETNEVSVMLNTMKAPFNDIKARQALAYATDRQKVVQVLFDGLYQTSEGPFAPSSPWYAKTNYPSYDPEKAKALVKELGGLKFSVYGVSDPRSLNILQLVVDDWNAVGIEASIDTIEQAQLIQKVVFGDYQATNWRQFDSPHPLGDSIWWVSDAAPAPPAIGLNFARNADKRIDDQLRIGRQTTDPAEEKKAYQEVMKLLGDDIPYIWLFHMRIGFASRSQVHSLGIWKTPEGAEGLPSHGGSHPLHQVWIEH